MKKILSLLLALALVFALIGCLPAGSTETPSLPSESLNVTEAPTEAPTQPSTEVPTETSTETPTEEPTEAPTGAPTEKPTEEPTEAPTEEPTEEPTEAPTEEPTEAPTEEPTEAPTEEPTEEPTEAPTEEPTEEPTEAPTEEPTEEPTEAPTEPLIYRDGHYTSKDLVALYIYTYGWLPSNYISKDDGNARYGSYKSIPSSMNIGGDRFYNREGLLPSGYTYYECDIGTAGGRSRGSLRLVFTTDGIVYYTSDHYRSFTRLY